MDIYKNEKMCLRMKTLTKTNSRKFVVYCYKIFTIEHILQNIRVFNSPEAKSEVKLIQIRTKPLSTN